MAKGKTKKPPMDVLKQINRACQVRFAVEKAIQIESDIGILLDILETHEHRLVKRVPKRFRHMVKAGPVIEKIESYKMEA